MPTNSQATFTTDDGTQLSYIYKPAINSDGEKKAIVLFHRGHEHSGRILHVADELALDEYDYFAWDARGHGDSPGDRGDSPSFETIVSDIQAFIDHIKTVHSIEEKNIAVIAQSVGAVAVSAWLHDFAPNIRCAVLASPAFKVKLYVPFARQGLALLQKIKGNFFVQSYMKAHYLSHDSERIKSFDNDPKITRAISVRVLLGLYQAAKRVINDAPFITTPIQLLVSGNDWVVHQYPQHRFYNYLGSHIKERHIFPDFYHDTLGEEDRHLAIEKMRNFITKLFSQPVQPVDCTQSDQYGFSRTEMDYLATPLSLFSPKGAFWALQRLGINFAAKWSNGLRVAKKTGFDSGSSLDYVYQNEPQGFGYFGRLIDKFYLNSVGWRCIRQRKVNMQILIQDAMKRLKEAEQPVHVLDIAAGHGRYVLDALTAETMPDSITLRDYSKLNVDEGRKLIQERKLEQIAQFNEVNAFDRNNYQDLSPRPTLGIVSGLHELFPSNQLINESLMGFEDTLSTGSYLLYTNQPWHPQLEMIGRCLTSHREGEAWVMRRRSQIEMDQLVSKAGFEKIRQLIDDDGIFTVTLARKL